jgi:hypothetical protein
LNCTKQYQKNPHQNNIHMAWRKWKLGLVISVLLGLLTAGSGFVDNNMSWESFAAVLCSATLGQLLTFLKTHPYETIQFPEDEDKKATKI